MIKFFHVLTLFGLISITQFSYANEYEDKARLSSLYQQLEKARMNGMAELNKIIVNPTVLDGDNIHVLSVWAKDAYIHYRDPRYGLIYSDALLNISQRYSDTKNLKDTAALMYFSSQLIVREDMNRCKFTPSITLISQWSSNDMYKSHFSNVDSKTQDYIFDRIIAFSNTRDLKEKKPYVCASSIQAVNKAIENGDCTKSGACNSTQYVSLDADFIEDSKWQKKRIEIQNGLKEYLYSK